MSVRFPLPAVVTVLLLSPSPLLAGGLPGVCLPVDGVTAATADACAKLIGDKLGEKVERVRMRENDKQWYVLFAMNAAEFDLDKLDAALKGSRFSIPRDRTRLFCRMALEIEVGAAAEQKLLTDLKAIKHLTLEESSGGKSVLFVTVVTPYPRHSGREVEDFGTVSFEKERFGAVPSDLTPKADPPAAPRDLPTYGDLRAVVEKHGGSIKASRLKLLGCHVQGGLIATDAKQK